MKRIARTAMCLLASLVTVCPAVDDQPRQYSYDEMENVSAAVAIGQDMFIACSPDENVLRVYEKNSPTPAACLDVCDFLGLDGESADGDPAGS